MARISRLRGGFTTATRSASCSQIPLRAFTTTSPNAGIREKLWKGGDAPGSKDPYTEKPADETTTPAVKERSGLSWKQRYIAASPIIVPQVRNHAATEQQAEENPMYEPAKTMDDLVETPPLKEWWEQPGHWDHVNHFRAFAPKEKTESKEVVEVFLRRAVGEALALREAGKLAEWCGGRKWNPPPRGGLHSFKAQIEVVDGVASVKNGSEIMEALEDKFSKHVWRHVKEWLTPEKAQSMVKHWDNDWKEIRLDDELKFAVSATSIPTTYKSLTCPKDPQAPLPVHWKLHLRLPPRRRHHRQAPPHLRHLATQADEAGRGVGRQGALRGAGQREETRYQDPLDPEGDGGG